MYFVNCHRNYIVAFIIFSLIFFNSVFVNATTLGETFRDVKIIFITVQITSNKSIAIEPRKRWALESAVEKHIGEFIKSKFRDIDIEFKDNKFGMLNVRVVLSFCCKLDDKLFVSSNIVYSRSVKRHQIVKSYETNSHGLHGFFVQTSQINLASRLAQGLEPYISENLVKRLKYTIGIEKYMKE